MTTPQGGAASERPPYLAAALTFLVVLAGYFVSLAPTVTFWDAGEFIATSHILGIPHPPGTPVFVLLGHVWDMVVPHRWLTTAQTTCLMSATFSAGSAGFAFLLMHEALRAGGMDRIARYGGAFAAALIGAFTFTNWQNSNETEVYQVAMFSIGLTGWLCWLWRKGRGGPRGAHALLLLIYALGAALGNHLMALLVGPAVVAFMFFVLRDDPARELAERNAQWAMWAVTGSLWVTLVGVGIANRFIVAVGLVLFLVAALWSWRARALLFAGVAFAAAAAGISTYLYLYIRAGHHPFINEADPSTWRNLWAVIGREQYPPRSPLDNPIYPSGADNPGRTLRLVGLQLLNYVQYFDWQWSAALQRARALLAPARLPFTVLFTLLGMLGLTEHRKWDRGTWWFALCLFVTTSVGLVIYLNFKPGFSIGYGTFPDPTAHEVRERDYFYTVSFVAWGWWAGLGLAEVYRRLRERFAQLSPWAPAPVFLVGVLPLWLNFGAADRHFLASATLPRDFAYDILIGVEPYGILFTNGDNDTFPLWYLQEVEGVRQDVMVVNLSLLNTDWYIRQLRDNPQRPYRPDANAIRLFGQDAGPMPPCLCLHTLSDRQIAALQPELLPSTVHFRAGNIVHDYPAGTPFYIKDAMVLRLILENLGKRPIYFALTSVDSRMGLDAYVLQQGINFKLFPDTVEQTSGRVQGLFKALVDVERTRVLAWDVFRYSRLFERASPELDPTDENIAGNLAFIYMSLGDAYRQLGDKARMVANYRKAAHLSPNPEMQRFLRQLEAMGGP